jgi:AcrR family transcriptional regulator
MHTSSTEVKSKRVAQGQATRQALVDAAAELFGQTGYAATSIDEIVAAAGVTKGAMYHHFPDKEALFKAVFERVQQQVSDTVAAEFLQLEPWEALESGCQLWIDAHLDPAVRQIALTDARAVLGWDAAREVETRFSAVALRGALRKAMRAEVIAIQPLRPLALMLTGALSEACLYVAQADDTDTARDEVSNLIGSVLSGLRVRPGDDATIPRVSNDPGGSVKGAHH